MPSLVNVAHPLQPASPSTIPSDATRLNKANLRLLDYETSGSTLPLDALRPTIITADPLASAPSAPHLFSADSVCEEETSLCFFDVPDLVEYIFPNDIFPPQINLDSLVKALMLPESELWDSEREIWKNCPLLDGPDQVLPDCRDAMPAFLNRIMQRIYEACRANRSGPISRPRKWTGKFNTQDLKDFTAPHLCLVQQRIPTRWLEFEGIYDDGPTWEEVISIGIDLSLLSSTDIVERFLCNAYRQFSAQPTRRFSVSVSFQNEGVGVHVLDCAGIVSSEPFDIHKEPARFVRLLAGMALVDDAHMGSDTSIKDRRVEIAGETYDLMDCLHSTQDRTGAIGPRTVISRALRNKDGTVVVIKDIWEDSEASFLNEAQMMSRVHGIEGVAQLVGSEVVTILGRKDTTAHIRRAVKPGHKHFHRLKDWITLYTHRRLVITPFAADLCTFRSKQELLNVFIDVVQTIARLEERHIMHGDISIGNVRIHDPNPTGHEIVREEIRRRGLGESGRPDWLVARRRRGILIDLDNALEFDANGNISSRPINYAIPGTTPFNSTELMREYPEGRRFIRYELESLFYVLIWVCYRYNGPNSSARPRREYPKPDDDAICKWFDSPKFTLQEACELKAAQMRFPGQGEQDKFEAELLPTLSSYFDDLRPCLRQIRWLMFGRGEQKITPGEMVEALTEGIRYLDEQAWRKEGRRLAAAAEAARREQQARNDEEMRGRVKADMLWKAFFQGQWAVNPQAQGPKAAQALDPRRRVRKSGEQQALSHQSPPSFQLMTGELQTPDEARVDVVSAHKTKRKMVEIDGMQPDSSEVHRTKRPRTDSLSRVSVPTGGACWDFGHHEEYVRLRKEYAEQQAEKARRRSIVEGKKRMMEEEDYLYAVTPPPKRFRASESVGTRAGAACQKETKGHEILEVAVESRKRKAAEEADGEVAFQTPLKKKRARS